MKQSEPCLRIRLFVLITIFSPVGLSGLENLTASLPAKDSLRAASDTSYRSLFAGMGYGSNMVYLGSTVSQNQPFGYAALTYYFNKELSLTISGDHLSGRNPLFAFYTISANYSHTFNSWFDISAGVSRYQVTPALTDTLFSSFTYADITLGFDWKLLYSKISAGGLISDENAAYFQLRNSRYFQTPEFSRNKYFISIDPYVNLLFGTLAEYKTITGTINNGPPQSRSWKSKRLKSETYISSSRNFNIMEIDIGIPVAFNAGNIVVESEISYVIPAYGESDLQGPEGFIFLLSAYFRIF